MGKGDKKHSAQDFQGLLRQDPPASPEAGRRQGKTRDQEKPGKLSRTRWPVLPNVPMVMESGLPGFHKDAPGMHREAPEPQV